jgi:class 3 adenylate cyclase
MAGDERSTIAALDAGRSVFKAQIESHQGHVIDMAGDSVLAMFETAIGAVTAALEIQKTLNGSVGQIPDCRCAPPSASRRCPLGASSKCRWCSRCRRTDASMCSISRSVPLLARISQQRAGCVNHAHAGTIDA